MRKIYYNNLLARLLLWRKDYETAMIFGFICTKRKQAQPLSSKAVNHEAIHVEQYMEVTAVALLAALMLSLAFGWGGWPFVVALLLYYIIYFVEAGISWVYNTVRRKLSATAAADTAYYASMFEMEAHANEGDNQYVQLDPLFRESMKKYLIVALVALSVITAFGFLIHQNKKLRRERDAYHNNTEVLLSEVERYQTKSGEQAVRVGELQLRVAELERYRADDAALIRDMGVKKKELEQLTKIQQQTIYKLQGKARDTVFVEVTPDRAAEVPARCAEHHDEWLDFSCCIFPDNSYKADVISRDRITYVERVKYARFLGFLWRTKRVKSRDQSIINHNPHAEIIDAEFITIRK